VICWQADSVDSFALREAEDAKGEKSHAKHGDGLASGIYGLMMNEAQKHVGNSIMAREIKP
jgi:hypothetical protein